MLPSGSLNQATFMPSADVDVAFQRHARHVVVLEGDALRLQRLDDVCRSRRRPTRSPPSPCWCRRIRAIDIDAVSPHLDRRSVRRPRCGPASARACLHRILGLGQVLHCEIGRCVAVCEHDWSPFLRGEHVRSLQRWAARASPCYRRPSSPRTFRPPQIPTARRKFWIAMPHALWLRRLVLFGNCIISSAGQKQRKS